jgi:hypothetical protein
MQRVNRDLVAARAARDVIRAGNDGSPAFWELLRAANHRIRELLHEQRTEPSRTWFTVTVTTDDQKWVESFDSAEGAAAEVFEHLALIEGAAFTITANGIGGFNECH